MSHVTSKPLEVGQTIGILGGGQLGRMLAVSASRLGLQTHIFEPGATPPAAQVANHCTTASYEDEDALTTFARSVDVITYEFENIPTSALDLLEKHRPVLPGRNALAVSQDRLLEKKYIQDLGIRVAPFANIENVDDFEAAYALGAPSILKTRRFGYDGKGQVKIDDLNDLAPAWEDLKRAPCVLEGFVNFTKEISVIAARNAAGEVVCFDPGENVHKNGILHTTDVPGTVTEEEQAEAVQVATTILTALEYVGVMGVELFVTEDGLVVNEVAPRVHNSGHWTQNGCAIDQFEQHIRAVAGWPLGDGVRHSDVLMTNLIGEDVQMIDELRKNPTVAIHLYGKEEVRDGRKMGHVNRVI